MGWFSVSPEGESFTGELTWGDGPADAFDGFVTAAVAEFQEAWSRPPTLEELRAGIEFSLKVYDPADHIAIDETASS